MAVRPETLQNPERGLDLLDREAAEGARPRKRDDAAAELAAVRERIEAAKKIRPLRPSPHCCGTCWGDGRDAAIRVIEGK